jgi:hypothetical protein
MGVDWVRMKLRPGVDAAEVTRLSEACNRRNVKGWIPGELTDADEGASWTEPGPENRRAANEFWERLKGLVELPPAFYGDFELQHLDGDTAPDDPAIRLAEITRVYVVTHNPVFPPEWRRAAYATILPAELADRLHHWSEYIGAVRRGEYRGYLYELFLALSRRELSHRDAMEELRSALAESFERTNAWTQKEKFLKVREQLLADPMLSTTDAHPLDRVKLPGFDPARRDEPLDPSTFDAHESLAAAHRQAADLVRSWNRCVPHSRQLPVPRLLYRDFDAFLAVSDDGWLDAFFAWCRHLTEQGEGLLLWG